MADNQVKIDITAEVAGFNAKMAEAQAHLNKMASAFNDADRAATNGSRGMKQAEDAAAKLDGVLMGVAKRAAVAFVGWKTAELAWDMAQLNARFETLGVVMDVVGRNAGYSKAEVDAYAKNVQSMGITMTESRQTVIAMMQAQMDLTNATKLARVAQDAAVIGNTNSSEALNRLIYGIQSAQVDVLRTIGINVSFEDSYKKLAGQIGKSAESLTEQEKVQARTNAVMEQGATIAGSYEAAMGTAGKQMSSLARYHEDLKVILGEAFNDALVGAVTSYTDGLKGATEEAKRLQQQGDLREFGRDLAMVMAYGADALNNFRLVVIEVATRLAVLMKTVQTAGSVGNAMAAGGGGLVGLWVNREAIKQAFDERERFVNEANAQSLANLDKFGFKFAEGMRKQFEVSDAHRQAVEDIERLVKAGSDQRKAGNLGENEVIAYAGKVAEYLKRGEIGAMEYSRAMEDLTGQHQKLAVSQGEVASGGKKAQSDYEKLLSSIREKTAQLVIESGQTEKLSDAQKLLLEIEQGRYKLTPQHKAVLQAKVQELALLEAEAEARRHNAETDAEITKEQGKAATERYEALVGGAQTLSDETRRLNADMLMDDQARARAQIDLESEKWILIIHAARDAYATMNADDRARLEGVLQNMEAAYDRWRAAKVAQANFAEFKKGWEETDRIAREMFTGWGTHGEDTFKRLGETLKSALLNAVYEATLKPVVFQVYSQAAGMLGLPTFGAGGSTGGLFDLASNASSLFNGGGLMGTSAAYGLAGFGGEAGAMLAAQTGGFGAAGLAATMEAGGVAGGGLISGLGAALPWVGGALAVSSLLGGDLFGGDDGPAERSATVYQYGIGEKASMSDTSAFGPMSVYSNNKWFGQGTESVVQFQDSLKALDDRIAALLSPDQIAAVTAALQADKPTSVGFGPEWTEWTQSQADEQIFVERYGIILNAIKPGLADLAAQAGWSADKIVELAETLGGIKPTAEEAAAALEEQRSAALRLVESTRDALAGAYQREMDAQQALADKMLGLADGLSRLRSSLLLGDLSPLGVQAKYEEARRQFDAVSSRARLGDTAAMEQLDGMAQSFLGASRAWNASSADYASDFWRVQDVLESTESVAERHARISQDQLAVLGRQLASLGDINVGVTSIDEALRAYNAAKTGAALAGVGVASAPTGSGIVANGVSYGMDEGRFGLISPGNLTYSAYTEVLGRAPRESGANYWESYLSSSGVRDSAGVDVFLSHFIAAAVGSGGTDAERAVAYARAHGIPGYASGGVADGLFTAGEAGTELIYSPAPVRVLSAADTRAAVVDGGEIATLLRDVLAELRAANGQRGAAAGAQIERLDALERRLANSERAAIIARTGTNG